MFKPLKNYSEFMKGTDKIVVSHRSKRVPEVEGAKFNKRTRLRNYTKVVKKTLLKNQFEAYENDPSFFFSSGCVIIYDGRKEKQKRDGKNQKQ